MARRTRPVKPLNEPIPVNVRHDGHGLPVAVELLAVLPATSGRAPGANRRGRNRGESGRSTWLNVAAIEDMYEVDELWWRGEEQEIQRLYFDLRLENARRVTVYRDLIRDRWYKQAD